MDLTAAAAEPRVRPPARGPSLLPDELVRALVAAGQVDVLAGIPTLDNAETVGDVVRAVIAAFAGPLARKRCLVLDADGGSHDATREIVRGIHEAGAAPVVTTHALRTIHRISAPYHGVPGRGSGLRLLFAAADLVGARAVVVVAPDARDLTADTVATLARAVLDESCDFVKPRTARSPWERPLVTQLVAPLMSAAYGRRLADPVATQFACSGTFAARSLKADLWEKALAHEGIDLWLSARAMVDPCVVGEVWVPDLTEPVHASRPRAREAFQQVVGPLFESLLDDQRWLDAKHVTETRRIGSSVPPSSKRPAFDVAAFRDAFGRGVADLAPILEPALGADLLRSLRASAAAAPVRLDDDLWAHVVWAALVAVGRRALPASQIVAALFPIYLGRVATFLEETRDVSAEAAEAHHDRLFEAFVRTRADVPAFLRDATR